MYFSGKIKRRKKMFSAFGGQNRQVFFGVNDKKLSPRNGDFCYEKLETLKH